MIENLPSFVDNIKISKFDNRDLWIGTPAMRNSVIDVILSNSWIRKILLNLRISLMVFMLFMRIDTSGNGKLAGGFRVDERNGNILECVYGNGK